MCLSFDTAPFLLCIGQYDFMVLLQLVNQIRLIMLI